MAKMFYTMDEAKNVLGRSEDEIKGYAREGKLREFRDGARLMFKADQVETLRAELASHSGDHVDLGMSDSGGMIDLVDTTAASGTSVTLSDDTSGGEGTALGVEALHDQSGSFGSGLSSVGSGLSSVGTGSGAIGSGSGGIGTSPAGSSRQNTPMTGPGLKTKDDTALAADLGLSGTAAAIPSPGRALTGLSGTGLTGLSGSAGGSRAGINVFGTDDLPDLADPSAQTAINPVQYQEINLESVGSGSGLLDLSRERDDTSLGAVLEEINPIQRGDDAGMGGSVELEEPSGAFETTRGPVAPVYVQAHDPLAAAFGWASLAAAGVCLFGIFALVCGMLGTHPDALKWFDQYKQNQFFLIVGMGVAAAVIFFIGGALIGKVTGGRS
jgi:hypothetical protein